ncbi:MAG: Dabb family protein [Ginsengibacter sp.]
MKFLFVLLTVFTFGVSAFSQSNDNGNKQLRHVVIFKFKDSSSAEDVKKVAETFAGLHGKVPQVKAFEWGVNNSPEHFNEGFTHCFILTFSSEKDLAEYQSDPAHKAFQAVLKPHMDKVFVVDYWVK